LLETVDLADEDDRLASDGPAQPFGFGHDVADFLDPASTALKETKRARVVSAMIRASVSCRYPAAPQDDRLQVAPDRPRSGFPDASRSSCPTNSSESAAACARQRCAGGVHDRASSGKRNPQESMSFVVRRSASSF
jgi:hypothetical protein